MNITKTYNYMNNTFISNIEKQSILNIFKYVKNEIKRYYIISYKSEKFNSIGEHEIYGIDES